MPWWGWMIVGALLLGSELMIVDAGFYLVFLGIAAAITGLIELAGADLEPWVQWILFSIIALVFMVLFRKKLYAKLRGSGIGYEVGPTGEIVTVEQALQPGETGRMAYRGTEWTVVNTSDQAFEQGQHVQISSVDGLTLKLDAVKTQE
ncbi:MAG: NfeD family protein [Gammaproteobacteria bacterium]|nr:NfeD family protein [Gammaproteobacteria bacterium]MDH3857991.1 NfeD family protein [Gammaproteobacteria bacterium]